MVVKIERIATNRGSIALEMHFFQAGVVCGFAESVESIEFRGAVGKCPISDIGHAGGDYDTGQIGAPPESINSDTGDLVRECDVGQVAATGEGVETNTGDTVGNRDTGQFGAAFERPVVNGGNTAGNGDVGVVGAAGFEFGTVFAEMEIHQAQF